MRPRRPETARASTAAHDGRMIHVQRGKLIRMAAGAPRTVTAHSGRVWVTEPSNLRDVVLGAGESFTLPSRGSRSSRP